MKKVLITGTASGIGLATVELLRDHGYIVHGMTKEECNFDDLDAVKAYDTTGYDVLINNAAHGRGLGKSIRDIDTDDMISQVHVNLLAPMILTQNFLRQNSQGTIINVTSSAVNEIKQSGEGVYTVTKRGLSDFTIMCHTEHRETHRFVELIVSRVDTPFVNKTGGGTSTSALRISPLKCAEGIKLIIEEPTVNALTIKDSRR